MSLRFWYSGDHVSLLRSYRPNPGVRTVSGTSVELVDPVHRESRAHQPEQEVRLVVLLHVHQGVQHEVELHKEFTVTEQ